MNPSLAGQIQLQTIERPDEYTLCYRFTVQGLLRRYVQERSLWIRYSEAVVTTPPAIAAIPFAAIFSPLVWSVGGRLELPELEASYAGSLDRIRDGYVQMFPTIDFAGQVVVANAPEIALQDRQATAMLFSGGIDSLCCLLSHREENPLLISVRGSDVRLHQQLLWEKVNADQAAVAQGVGLQRVVVETNFMDVIRMWALDLRFMDKLARNWYADIGHGQILLGFCAPISWQCQIGLLYIASSFPEAANQAGGSCQLLDEASSWGGLRVVHEGTTQSRQDKVELVAAALRRTSQSLPLRVCYLGSDGGQCGVCEKCSRTMAGLALAGADPARFGFAPDGKTPDWIRRCLERNSWQLPFPFFWTDLQQRLPQSLDRCLPQWHDFFSWLAAADLPGLIRRRPHTVRERCKRWLRRQIPFACYERLRCWKRRLWGPGYDY